MIVNIRKRPEPLREAITDLRLRLHPWSKIQQEQIWRKSVRIIFANRILRDPPTSVMNSLVEADNQINNIYPGENIFSTGVELGALYVHMNHVLSSILVEGRSVRYILLKEIPEDMSQWINNGRADKSVFHTLSHEKEKELKSMCNHYGFTVTQGTQKMEYMNHTVEIGYIWVKDPTAGTSVALIPWFMVPRKKCPVFVYLYAYWYYTQQHKSERETARVTEKLFGVNIHFSTVSRSLSMARAFSAMEGSISADPPADVPFGNILKAIPELLAVDVEQDTSCPPCGNPAKVLANIPLQFAEIIRRKTQTRATPPVAPPVVTRIRRSRATGHCAEGKSSGLKVKPLSFISDKEIGIIRCQFIALCQNLVLNVATQYHKFLI